MNGMPTNSQILNKEQVQEIFKYVLELHPTNNSCYFYGLQVLSELKLLSLFISFAKIHHGLNIELLKQLGIDLSNVKTMSCEEVANSMANACFRVEKCIQQRVFDKLIIFKILNIQHEVNFSNKILQILGWNKDFEFYWGANNFATIASATQRVVKVRASKSEERLFKKISPRAPQRLKVSGTDPDIKPNSRRTKV